MTSPLSHETSILAGGCFWGMEEILRQTPGILKTRVGYTGGQSKDPIYEQVKTGTTGHAEAIEVTFNPQELSYAQLLRLFFRMHDPTTLDRQGGDIGSQYRSSIFYFTPEQQETAKNIIHEVNLSGFWQKPIVTTVVSATTFYSAETYHQKYLEKNPGGYTCHFIRK